MSSNQLQEQQAGCTSRAPISPPAGPGGSKGAIDSALQASETSNALLGTAEVQHYSNALKAGTT